jgi:hypothetical protein
MVCGTVCAFGIWFVHLKYGFFVCVCVCARARVRACDIWCGEQFVHLMYGVCGMVCAFLCLLSAIRERVLN